MRPYIDPVIMDKWFEARRQVRARADVVLGEAATRFLCLGKLYGEGEPGRYISSFLGSAEGCETVLRLIEQLEAEEPLEAVVVDLQDEEPAGPGRPVLKLIVGHLCHRWPNGRREPV